MPKIGLIVGVAAVVLVAAGGALVALETRVQPKEAGVGVGVAEKPTAQKPAPVADSTAGWKVYRNDKYGFEFQYPPEFGFEEMSGKGVEYTGHPELVLYFGKLGDDVEHYSSTLSVFYNTPLFVAEAYSDVLDTATKIVVNGHAGFRISPNQAGGESVYVQKDDKVTLKLSCSPSELCPETEREIFDQVVETLRFQTKE